ncbi:MAG: VOC family protein [Planctomycetes bacterium]|nr:VOC family protein [Planctomycetota bacterium]
MAARGNLYPSFCYTDAPRAIEFLVRAFGFEQRLVVPGPDGTVMHSELEYEGGVIMVSSPKAERNWAGASTLPLRSSALSVHVADPDAHCARARAAGAQITRELQDEEYGSRGYMARDTEGNDWYFGTYVPGGYWEKGGA